jgi:hypothetical protein
MNPIRKPQINAPFDHVKIEQIRTYLFALVDELNYTLFRQEREIATLREELKQLKEKQEE